MGASGTTLLVVADAPFAIEARRIAMTTTTPARGIA